MFIRGATSAKKASIHVPLQWQPHGPATDQRDVTQHRSQEPSSIGQVSQWFCLRRVDQHRHRRQTEPYYGLHWRLQTSSCLQAWQWRGDKAKLRTDVNNCIPYESTVVWKRCKFNCSGQTPPRAGHGKMILEVPSRSFFKVSG